MNKYIRIFNHTKFNFYNEKGLIIIYSEVEKRYFVLEHLYNDQYYGFEIDHFGNEIDKDTYRYIFKHGANKDIYVMVGEDRFHK